MPKIVELTVEINIEKVSCPGVWLCQYGRVSLSVFALGTGYQTCFLPPVFPLLFKDVFYFQKKYPATCTIDNISCLLNGTDICLPSYLMLSDDEDKDVASPSMSYLFTLCLEDPGLYCRTVLYFLSEVIGQFVMQNESIYCELIQWSDSCRTDDCVVLAQYMGSLTDVLFPPNVCSLEGVDLLMRRTDVFPGILAPKIEISTKIRVDEVYKNDRSISDDIKNEQCLSKTVMKPHHSSNYCRNAERHRPKSHSSRSCCSVKLQQKHAYEDNPKNYCNPACVESKHPKHKLTLESRFIEHDTAIDEAVTSQLKEQAWYKVRPCSCDICRRYHEMFHQDKSC